MSDLTTEEKQEIIRKNPDYGVIICRCEGISKGEIVDTIHSPIPQPRSTRSSARAHRHGPVPGRLLFPAGHADHLRGDGAFPRGGHQKRGGF